MAKLIEYFYAPISGYAYLGEQRLVQLAAEAGASVEFKPVDIARVFAASETTAPFKQSQARIKYRMKDMQRTADYLGIAINPKPKHWPVPVELAAKTIYAAIELGVEPHAISFALLSAVYAHELDVSSAEALSSLLLEMNLDANSIEARRASTEISMKYDEATQQAIEYGVFGSPTYVVDGELFFGQDRLEMLATAL